MYTANTKINNQLSIWLIVMFWIISFMIIVGGLTRLTDSGLSITEWELFSGFFPPLNQNDWIFYFNLYKIYWLLTIYTFDFCQPLKLILCFAFFKFSKATFEFCLSKLDDF